MMGWEISVLFVGAMLVGIAYGYLHGRDNGREKERDRCMWLVHSALMRKNSGTLRWVGNAINSGATKLLPHDQFFDEGDK